MTKVNLYSNFFIQKKGVIIPLDENKFLEYDPL